MNKFLSAILSGAAALGLSTSLLAQVATPGGIEGPISAIVDNGDGSVTLTVMGMTVIIPPTATVASPSKPLTFAEIIDTTPLAGRTAPGWIGATAKGTGTTTAAGVVVIEDVIFEPAENVVIGIITGTQPLTVNHMPVRLSTDPRIPAPPSMTWALRSTSRRPPSASPLRSKATIPAANSTPSRSK